MNPMKKLRESRRRSTVFEEFRMPSAGSGDGDTEVLHHDVVLLTQSVKALETKLAGMEAEMKKYISKEINERCRDFRISRSARLGHWVEKHFRRLTSSDAETLDEGGILESSNPLSYNRLRTRDEGGRSQPLALDCEGPVTCFPTAANTHDAEYITLQEIDPSRLSPDDADEEACQPHTDEAQRQISTMGTVCAADIEEYRRLHSLISKGEHHAIVHDLKMNMWSCGIYALVEDIPYLVRGHNKLQSIMRAFVILLVMLINIGLQAGFLIFISQDLLSPAIHAAQMMYARYHAIAFDDAGLFSVDDFAGLGEMQKDLCQIPLSNLFFLLPILFLWITTCFTSLMELSQDMYVFQKLPKLPPGISITEMIVESDAHDGFDLLVCISTWTRMTLWAVIFLPQLLIILSVTFMGSLWLIGTLNFGDLILNSLALNFITEIDELLFDCFMPQRLKDDLAATKVIYPSPQKHAPFRRQYSRDPETDTPEDTKARHEDRQHLKRTYAHAVLKLVAVLLCVTALVKFQQVIPNYAWDVHISCDSVLQDTEDLLCYPLQSDCFPYGDFSALALKKGAASGLDLDWESAPSSHVHGHHGR